MPNTTHHVLFRENQRRIVGAHRNSPPGGHEPGGRCREDLVMKPKSTRSRRSVAKSS